MSSHILNDIKMLQMSEPLVLLLGENFDKNTESDISSIKWSCVYSLCKDSEIASLFKNERREIKSIIMPSDLKKYAWNIEEMPFVWLLGHDEYTSESRSDNEIESDAINMFSYVNNRLTEFGRIVCIGFDADSEIIDTRVLSRVAYDIRRSKLIYILSADEKIQEDKKCKDLIEAGYAEVDSTPFLDLFGSDSDFDIYDDSLEQNIESRLSIYINGKMVFFDDKEEKQTITRISQIVTLLDYKSVQQNIPIPREQRHLYFKNFLRFSNVRDPQWFGYREEYGFHIKRDFEEDLYNKTIDALKDAGTRERNCKPIMLCGQACSGKTSALKALAVKIFEDRVYPVIYIGDSELDFITSYSDKEGMLPHSIFHRLETLISLIESKAKGPNATLIIWDTASYNEVSRSKAVELLTSLRSFGRNVQLVCSSYEFVNEYSKEQYDTINIDIQIDDKEKNKIYGFFESAGISAEDIKRYVERYQGNPNFLSTLYMIDELKANLQEQVSREVILGTRELVSNIENAMKQDTSDDKFETVISLALKRALEEADEGLIELYADTDLNEHDDISQDFKEFIIILSICKWYGKDMPYTLFLRLLGAYSSKSLRVRQAVSSATFLNFSTDEKDYWNSTVSVKTELEAKLLLISFNINPETPTGKSNMLQYITKMLDLASGSNNFEVNVLRGILRIIGPNNKDEQIGKKSLWSDAYDEIPKLIQALINKREKENDKNYILQEITLRREYYRDEKCKLSPEEKYNQYDEAKTIAEIRISELRREEGIFENHFGMSPVLSRLLVESANLAIRMFSLGCDENSYSKSLFRDVSEDMQEVIHKDPGNAYAYSTFVLAGLKQIERNKEISGQYSENSLRILASIRFVIDIFMNSSLKFSEESIGELRKSEAKIETMIDEVNNSDELFEMSITEKRPELIYLRVNRMLRAPENNVTEKFGFRSAIENAEQLQTCKSAIEMLDEYKAITYEDAASLFLLINLKWLYYNRFPLLGMPECMPTKLTAEEWSEIEQLCEQYSQHSKFRRDSITYLHALSIAEKNDFRRALEILKPLAESRSYEKRALHILCKENGEPIQYRGRLKSDYDRKKKRGYMNVFYENTLIDNNVIYRAENIHSHESELKRDKEIYNVEISFSFTGFQAHTKSKSYNEIKEDIKI